VLSFSTEFMLLIVGIFLQRLFSSQDIYKFVGLYGGLSVEIVLTV